MLGFDAVAQMALSDGTATSRFSNWSQHLDFGLFKVLAKQPTATALDLDLGTEPDKVLWEASKDNPFQWPKIRKGIHTVVPMFHVLIWSVKMLDEADIYIYLQAQFNCSDNHHCQCQTLWS